MIAVLIVAVVQSMSSSQDENRFSEVVCLYIARALLPSNRNHNTSSLPPPLFFNYTDCHIILRLKTTGGGEGGRKMLTKARTRLRSRAAYKKLPTSVQDAMTSRHND